jgi:hypothetical protein
VGGQVGDASDGIALDLDVGRVHLLDEGSQATEGDNGDLVLGCGWLAAVDAVCVCMLRVDGRTVDSQVAQGGARCSLDLEIRVLEQEQDGLEGIAVDFADIWAC